MFRHLLKLRYIAAVIVVGSVLHALAFLVMGVSIAVKAYRHVLTADESGEAFRPGVELLHSIDFLFVSLVLLVLSLGIAKLFLLSPEAAAETNFPRWLRIENITELKVLLWETILTTLLIASLSGLVSGLFGHPDWSVLVLPVGILILALSLYFMKKS